ncbi:MAG: peptide chain release factor N(5)-glutamine methyltransferase, partial [Candidatus Kapaibacteriota bacterium]
MNQEQSRKVWTVSELITWGKNYLEARKIESPRLSIELLLCEILSCSRLDLYLNYDKPLSVRELNELKSKIKALACGQPLQFILGWAQFLNYRISLGRRVFIPRPETEILVKLITDTLKSRKDEPLLILDIGCG